MGLQWQKAVPCPDVPDCDCAEPDTEPSFQGQLAYTDCGGSSSSSSSSSSPSSSSVECSETCEWRWQLASMHWNIQLPCITMEGHPGCDCEEPTGQGDYDNDVRYTPCEPM